MASWRSIHLLIAVTLSFAPGFAPAFAEDCPPPEVEIPLPKGMAEVDSTIDAVPLAATGSAPCSKPSRDSLDSPSSCCTSGMMTEIRGLSNAALPKIEAAVKALSSPASKEDLLWKHFRVKPSETARIQVIKNRLEEIATSVRSQSSVTYFCRDSSDDACAGGKRRAATENCSSTRPPRMWFCGAYSSSTFFSGPGWLRTFVHEHAHAGCHVVGEMTSAGTETYNHEGGGYPPTADRAIKNADSYASFALEFY